MIGQLLIEHTVHGDNIDLTLMNVNAVGNLIDQQGRTLMTFKNSSRLGDIITIGSILTAAGITLEDQSLSPLAHNETLRTGGIVILVFIEYR